MADDPTPGPTHPDARLDAVFAHDPAISGRLLAQHWLEVDALLRQADLKAQIALGIAALLLSSLGLEDGMQFTSMGGTLEVGALGLLLGSLAAALSTLIPRHGRPTGTDGDLLYIEAAATVDPDDFVERYLAVTQDAYVRHVMHQIHVKSQIATTKLARVRLAFGLLSVAIVAVGLSLAAG